MTRVDTWTRNASRVWAVPQGGKGAGLWDSLALASVTNADSPTITARAYVDDGLRTPTTITGANAVTLTWQSGNNRWAGELPYITAFDTLSSVRVIVTATVSTRTAVLMDASVRFANADGR